MVEIHVFIEGITSIEGNEATFDRSNVFRQAIHKLLSQAFKEDTNISLIIDPSGGWKAAAKTFIRSRIKNTEIAFLIIDLEGKKEIKVNRLSENISDVNKSLELYKDEVFFMIQKMEAWIFSQPESIEAFADGKSFVRKVSTSISQHPFLQVPHPEEIVNPDEKLDTIFRQYFQDKVERKGKVENKPVRYHKTLTAPYLLMNMNFDKLSETFDEVQFLKMALQKIEQNLEKEEILLDTPIKKKLKR